MLHTLSVPQSHPAESGDGSVDNVAEGQHVFAVWARRMAAGGEFRASTVQTYGAIWNAWLAWLTARGLIWSAVDAVTIQVYLDGPSPGLAHHRPALRVDRMANYTRQRYWRVLRAVYAEGVRSGMLVSNPVLDVPQEERPVIDLSSRQSQVLPPGLLALLRDPAVIETCIPVIREAEWWSVRDRAAMLVLAHLGVTTRELMALRGSDALPYSVVPSTLSSSVPSSVSTSLSDASSGVPGLPTSGAVGAPVALTVPKDGEMLSRTLDVNDAVACALQAWLLVRREVLGLRLARRVGAKAASVDLLDAVCRSAPLFMSRQRSAAQIAADRAGGSLSSVEEVGLLPQMEASNVYSMVKRCLDAVYRLPALAGQHPKLRGLNQASGAAIIRNTVLLDWVQTVGEETAALWAGLRSVDSLRVSAQV